MTTTNAPATIDEAQAALEQAQRELGLADRAVGDLADDLLDRADRELLHPGGQRPHLLISKGQRAVKAFLIAAIESAKVNRPNRGGQLRIALLSSLGKSF